MERISVDSEDPDRESLRTAADTLLAGGLVAFPTETVYGLGALALDPVAARKIFEAKGRPSDDPLIVHVRRDWDLSGLFLDVSGAIARLAETYWPGPLTIVAAKHPDVPDVVTAGRDTVAVRAPSHPVAAMLLELVGEPIAAPSANRFSYVSPTTAAHVALDLGDVIDVLVDGGPTPIGIESTIVAVDGDRLSVLRPGSIHLAGVDVDVSQSQSASPGRMEVHYSPSSPTRVLTAGVPLDSRGGAVGVYIGYEDSARPPDGWEFVSLGDRRNLEAVGRRLYGALREVDESQPSVIVIEYTGLEGFGAAIDDRIRRAAGGQSVY